MNFRRLLVLGGLITANGLMALPSASVKSCVSVTNACQAAGYIQNHHVQGKGLYVDCFQPVLKGKIPKGVSVSAADVSDCNQKRALWLGNKK